MGDTAEKLESSPPTGEVRPYDAPLNLPELGALFTAANVTTLKITRLATGAFLVQASRGAGEHGHILVAKTERRELNKAVVDTMYKLGCAK